MISKIIVKHVANSQQILYGLKNKMKTILNLWDFLKWHNKYWTVIPHKSGEDDWSLHIL